MEYDFVDDGTRPVNKRENDPVEFELVSKMAQEALSVINHCTDGGIRARGITKWFKSGNATFRLHLHCIERVDPPIDQHPPEDLFIRWMGFGFYGAKARKLRRHFQFNMLEIADYMHTDVVTISKLERNEIMFTEKLAQQYNDAVKTLIKDRQT